MQLVQNLELKSKTSSKKDCVAEHRHLESFSLFEGIIRLVSVLIQTNLETQNSAAELNVV